MNPWVHFVLLWRSFRPSPRPPRFPETTLDDIAGEQAALRRIAAKTEDGRALLNGALWALEWVTEGRVKGSGGNLLPSRPVSKIIEGWNSDFQTPPGPGAWDVCQCRHLRSDHVPIRDESTLAPCRARLCRCAIFTPPLPASPSPD